VSDNRAPLGAIRSIQVPNGRIQLGKVVDYRMHDGIMFALIRWIDVRRDAEWVPSFTVPPESDADA